MSAPRLSESQFHEAPQDSMHSPLGTSCRGRKGSLMKYCPQISSNSIDQSPSSPQLHSSSARPQRRFHSPHVKDHPLSSRHLAPRSFNSQFGRSRMTAASTGMPDGCGAAGMGGMSPGSLPSYMSDLQLRAVI